MAQAEKSLMATPPIRSAQIAALLDGTLDLAFLRDGDPTEGVQMSTLLREPYVPVLPAAHALARKRTLCVGDLRREPFIFYARRVEPPWHSTEL